ncbi:uncharacterized protein TRIVIDRAFT_61700 [Trichoderma virens Gv29-8]|uniref:Transcription factor domain-containing protein n=1 Tax=Hypocrea virens (strain Gv29-8 / FGSC 10586) TaxID=413071 RepID=G9ML54_HYPVG|nr:uncharacterized protein TRIVIDRAFT_61700 [Trichoderma virens Gv29-8]EHK24948.1 hypothetical protein TRIVIDRAFT_61700 [Trichoderma virens Gv29-8]UKZ55214.1 hypothetical protein TrVGV298_009033 [Trichoderma virens]
MITNFSTRASPALPVTLETNRVADAGCNNDMSLPEKGSDHLPQGPGKQHFMFVTVGEPSIGGCHNKRQIPKTVRAQVMRDYVWKRDLQISGPDDKRPPSNNAIKPADLKGRFRLNTSARKTGNRTKIKPRSGKAVINLPNSRSLRATNSPLTVLGVSYDPFDAFMLRLGPESMRLIHHYYRGCSMSLVAYNIGERECLTNARGSLALFHSILYVVSLVYNLDHSPKDQLGSLFHSIEAFRAINVDLEAGSYTDMTIAAVALMATKETLEGNFASATVHMDGLQIMIKNRGGILNLTCRNGKAALWFTPRSVTMHIQNPPHSEDAFLVPADTFGPDSGIIPVIKFLRNVTLSMNTTPNFDLRHLNTSQDLYNMEYQLHSCRANLESATFAKRVMLLSLAMHLYLYLVIRHIPTRSKLVITLVQRLMTAIDEEATGDWEDVENGHVWLLWILFVGFGGSSQDADSGWFVERIQAWRTNHPDCDPYAGLDSQLRRVLWHNVWCGEQLEQLYNRLLKLVK